MSIATCPHLRARIPRLDTTAPAALWYTGRVKVTVDFELCQSHGLCTQNVPEVFEIRDDGFLYILDENPPESLRTRLQSAVRECPTGAISVTD